MSSNSNVHFGIVITSKPIIRFFTKVLNHPIGSKNYDNGVWNSNKLSVPEIIQNCGNINVIKAYVCGIISSDGSVPYIGKFKRFKGISVSGISEHIHDIGRIISNDLGGKVYFHKRNSTSKGKTVIDAEGNAVRRYDIILPDLNDVNSCFGFPFAYESKRNRLLELTNSFL